VDEIYYSIAAPSVNYKLYNSLEFNTSILGHTSGIYRAADEAVLYKKKIQSGCKIQPVAVS
jgi:hypothetical protein